MIKEFFKKNKEHSIAFIVFVILACAVYYPALQGYTVKQGDIVSFNSSAKELQDFREINGEEAIWTNTVFGGMPGYQMSVSYSNGMIFLRKLTNLGLPHPVSFVFISLICFYFLARVLKTNYLIAIMGAVMYTFVTYNVLILEAGHNTKMLTIAYFPGILAAMLLILKGKNVVLATVVFSIILAFQLLAGHVQMIYYMMFVLIAVGIAELVVAIKNGGTGELFKRVGFLLIGVLFALCTNIGNYYDTINFSKQTMRGGNVLTITPDNDAVVSINPKKEKKKTKGLDPGYITYWSYGKQETYNLLVPNAKGSNPLSNKMFEELAKTNRNLPPVVYKKYQEAGGKGFGGYWGDQPGTSGPTYLGAIAVFLALLYLIFIHSPMKWALLVVTILGTMLSWGKNLGGLDDMWLTQFFIDYVPMYNKFRAVSTMLVIVSFTVPIMAILFLKRIVTDQDWAKKNLKNIAIAGGTITLIVLFLGISPNIFDFTNELENKALATHVAQSGIDAGMIKTNLESYRISEFKADSFRTVGFIVVALALLLLGISNKVQFKYLLPALSVFVLADMLVVNQRFFNNDKVENKPTEYKYWQKIDGFQNAQRPTQGDMDIYKREVAQNPAIQGIINERVQQKRNELGREFKPNHQESIMFSTLNFNSNYRVMDVDNPFNSSRVCYFHKSTGGYHPAKLRRYQDMIDFYIAKEISFLNSNQLDKMKVLNMLNNKYYLYQGKLIASNPYAYGNAWFVDGIKTVDGPNEEILEIENIDPKTTAVVTKDFEEIIGGKSLSKDSTATISMLSYAPNYLVYNSKSKKEQLAVFSEVYYKDGWNAYIDGVKTPHLRVNYILRGLLVPAGEHSIEFKFEPASFSILNMISILAFVIMMGALAFIIYKSIKNKQVNA